MRYTTTKMKAGDIYKTMRDVFEYYIKDWIPKLPTTRKQWTAYGFLIGGGLFVSSSQGCTSKLEKAIQKDKASNPPIVEQQEQKDLEERCDWTLAEHSFYLYLVGTDSYKKLKVKEGEDPITIFDGPPMVWAYTERGKSPKGMAAYYIIDAVDKSGKIIYSCETYFSGFVYADPSGKTKVPPNEEQLGVSFPADPEITSIEVWYAKMNDKTNELKKVKLAIDPLKVPQISEQNEENKKGLGPSLEGFKDASEKILLQNSIKN